MDRQDFFLRHGIDEGQFRGLGITWGGLCEIYDEYSRRLPEYEAAAKSMAERLHAERAIHSIKYRVKDPEHLVEKVIRKMSQDPGAPISVGNFQGEIRDLVGIRALHLFKEDWIAIHGFLRANWEFCTPPKANYKAGDPDEILSLYQDMGCELYEHPNGYRSVHYNLRIGGQPASHPGGQPASQPGGQPDGMVAEIQVRTLFEEAWSEIDHHFRYRLKSGGGGGESAQYLGVINNLAYNADALASYLNKLNPSQASAAASASAHAAEGAAPAPAHAAEGGEAGVARVRDLYNAAKIRKRP